VLVLLAVAVVAVGGDDDQSASTGEAGPEVLLGEDEVFLEPINSLGPDSFTGEVFVDPASTLSDSARPEAPEGPTPSVEGQAVASQAAAEPGLYGGTQDEARCDRDQIVSFLQANADKAEAWAEALNADPQLRWSGGNSVTVAQIPQYIRELTPVLLRSDTRVTNNGFFDGRPAPRQAVLEAGTAVLVDGYGVPRTRCACGNPLTHPIPTRTTPTYTGDQWTRFTPQTTVVVQPPAQPITIIILIDIDTGDPFERPAGSSGDQDKPAEPTRWAISASGSASDLAESTDSTTTVNWSGTINVADDGTITGSAGGTATFAGGCYDTGTGEKLSDLGADGSFEIGITGTAMGERPNRSYQLQIELPQVTVTSTSPTGGNSLIQDCIAALSGLGDFVASAFTDVDVAATDGDTVVEGEFSMTVTLAAE
jgi:hypothetical protein